MAFVIFYPAVAGNVADNTGDDTWTNKRAALGDATGANLYAYLSSAASEDDWRWLIRSILVFDTSTLAGKTISNAWLRLHCDSKVMEESRGAFEVNIYSAAPANEASLAAGDFDSLGTTQFATDIAYATIVDDKYNVFVLNASGKAAISKTANTVLGLRESYYDAAGNEPPWVVGNKDSGIIFLASGAVKALFTTDTDATNYHQTRDILLGNDGYLYAGLEIGIVKVDPTTMAAVAYIDTPALCRNLMWWNNKVYYSQNTSPGKVYQINPYNMTIDATWTGDTGQNDACGLAHDDDYLYVATGGSGETAQIIPIDPSSMTTVSGLGPWTDGDTEGAFGLARMGDYLYIGIRDPDPGRVVKVTKSTLATNDTWTAASGTDEIRDVIADPGGSYIYVSHSIRTTPGKVSKVQVSDMSTSATWTGAAGQEACKKLYHDGTSLWVPCDITPAQLIKVDTSDMTTDDSWTGAAADEYAYMTQRDGDHVYLGLAISDSDPGEIIVIDHDTMTTEADLSPVPVLIVEYENPVAAGGVPTTLITGGLL